jgi:hypothetical protein
MVSARKSAWRWLYVAKMMKLSPHISRTETQLLYKNDVFISSASYRKTGVFRDLSSPAGHQLSDNGQFMRCIFSFFF